MPAFLWAQEENTNSATHQELIGNKLGSVVQEYPSSEKSAMHKVTVKGDWFYVDGERFLVKGVGYSGWRPHQLPWQERPDPKFMENDFRMIKDAGFNSLRTWTALNTKELALARKYGLMVLQGIFVDPTRDFASPIYQNYVVTTVKNQVRYYLKTPNILMFLIANEPPAERVRTSGVNNTIKVLTLMVDAVKQLDPSKIVTFSNWVQLAFLDLPMLPIAAFNVYMYAPDIVSHALTYKTYVEWLKKNKAKNRPLIITEFGLSVSSYGTGKMGRGGNTEQEQRDGDIMMWDNIINAGATGGCVFEWNDEWWKNYDYSGDQNKHETSDPEEWFGLIGIKDETSDYKGRPRLVYNAFKKYNQAILVNPKNIEFYKGIIPVEVYTTDNVKNLFYRINKGAWSLLQHTSRHWWTVKWDTASGKDGKQSLEIKALDETGSVLCTKERTIWINNQPGFVPPVLNIKITTNKKKYIIGQKMGKIILTVVVTDSQGRPVPNQEIDFAFYESRFWQSLHGSKKTDKDGKAVVEYYINESGFINIGVGSTLKLGEYTRRFGDVIAVEVEKIEKPKVKEGNKIVKPVEEKK